MNTITKEEYLETVGRLERLAMTLPLHPTDAEIASFMELEDVADAYEVASDAKAGHVTVTLEIDSRVLFALSRAARRRGMATKDCIVRILERHMAMEGNSQAKPLVTADGGLAFPVPEELLPENGRMDTGEGGAGRHGDGLLIRRKKEEEHGNS